MVYQIRHTNGFKTAEFELRAEAAYFLQNRPLTGLEVWILQGVPGQLIDITPANEFINTKQVSTHEL